MAKSTKTRSALDAAPKKPAKDAPDLGSLVMIRKRWSACVGGGAEQGQTDAEDDLKFSAGEQWDPEDVKARHNAGKPVMTVDMTGKFVRQVTGDIRINRPRMKFSPVDDGTDVEKAEIITGIVRNIENQSDADAAYVIAAEGAAKCGQGAFRINIEYSDDDAFDQDIRIDEIQNHLSVVWDPNARKPVRSDATYCFVVTRYSYEEYKARWPDATVSNFDDVTGHDWIGGWFNDESVTVAEYWYKKPVTKIIGRDPTGAVREVEDEKSFLEDAEQIGLEVIEKGGTPQEVKLRTVETHEVRRKIVSGSDILEDDELWPTKHIPIIPVFGEETYIGDTVVRRGIIRAMKDSNRMYNYARSVMAEVTGLSPKSPFVGTAKQIAGHEAEWERANIDNSAILIYTPDEQAPGPPQRERQPEVPVALIQDMQTCRDEMSETSGIYPSSLGQRSNETSGRAIIARDQQGDVGTFIYADNLKRAIRACGRQIIELIPHIYDGERLMRVLGEDDSEEMVTVNQVTRVVDGEGNVTTKVLNDLSVGKYDVIVDAGPSFSSRRQEASESLMTFIQAVPQVGELVLDLVAKVQDWPFAEEFTSRIRKLQVEKGIIEPDPEKGEQAPQQPPPDPRAMEFEAKARKLTAEADQIVAKTDLTKAETIGQSLDNMAAELQLEIDNGNMTRAFAQRVLDLAEFAAQPTLQQQQQTFTGP